MHRYASEAWAADLVAAPAGAGVGASEAGLKVQRGARVAFGAGGGQSYAEMKSAALVAVIDGLMELAARTIEADLLHYHYRY